MMRKRYEEMRRRENKEREEYNDRRERERDRYYNDRRERDRYYNERRRESDNNTYNKYFEEGNKIILKPEKLDIVMNQNFEKPAELNMDFIDNYNIENNNTYPTYPFFGGNENMGSSVAKQTIPTPANIFNLSPTSPFIPYNLGDKNL